MIVHLIEQIPSVIPFFQHFGSSRQIPSVIPASWNYLGISAFKSDKVFASSIGLSFRHRSILGKRTAIPLLWRLLSAMPSKAISKT